MLMNWVPPQGKVLPPPHRLGYSPNSPPPHRLGYSPSSPPPPPPTPPWQPRCHSLCVECRCIQSLCQFWGFPRRRLCPAALKPCCSLWPVSRYGHKLFLHLKCYSHNVCVLVLYLTPVNLQFWAPPPPLLCLYPPCDASSSFSNHMA